MKTLFIVRGLPGAGKSTLAEKLCTPDYIWEADKYFYDEIGNYNFDGDKLGIAHKWCQIGVEYSMQNEAGNIWFSSDWHLNHGNIAGPGVSKWGNGYRNFKSTQEMNEHLLLQINKYVKWDDTLYFLGDFCFGGHKLTPEWRSRINCQIVHLCRGNHDLHIDSYSDYFTSIQDVMTVKHGKYTFFLSHYKHAIWYGSHKGIIHLYGHSHSNAEDWIIGKSMDVGIDNAYKLLKEYKPFSVEEVIELMGKREVHQRDHHNDKTDL